jgi:hypothetical protein
LKISFAGTTRRNITRFRHKAKPGKGVLRSALGGTTADEEKPGASAQFKFDRMTVERFEISGTGMSSPLLARLEPMMVRNSRSGR